MSDSTDTTVAQTADALPPPPKPSALSIAWRELKKAPLSAKFGLLVILGYVFIALFAPVLTPYGESEIVGAEFEDRKSVV